MGARLERALINFFLDTHRARGFKEFWPPVICNRESMFGTGQLPKFEEDAFHVSGDMFLIPTAEVMLTNIHRGEVLDGDNPAAPLHGVHPRASARRRARRVATRAASSASISSTRSRW